jgi:uncharacterized protein (DUF1015 family)
MPLAAGLVLPEVAREVISPPYDLFSPNERAEHARNHPRSFLNGTPSEGDDPALDLSGRRRQAIEYLERELAAGTWLFLPEGLFVLQIESRGRTQTGVVGDVPASAFPELIRPHEHTRPDRVQDLASYLSNVGYFSSPVGLTYRRRADIDGIVDQVITRAPDLDATLPDRDRHRVWHLGDPNVVEKLLTSFDNVLASYIIDGHHRVAATLQRGADPSAKAGRFLAVAFPDDDLAIYPFHRWIEGSIPIARKGAADLTAEPGRAVILTPHGEEEIDLAVEPGESDVTALARTVLGPLFGVTDERTDARLAFVPGYPGPEKLRNLVKEQGGVGFLLAPTTVEAVMAVADRGGVMPPKATFFSPKPRSGVFLVRR